MTLKPLWLSHFSVTPPPISTVPCPFMPGLKEANDIVLYLKPLRILLEEMEQADFTAVC